MDRRRRFIWQRYLCNRFWGWRFYLSGLLLWTLIEAWLLLTETRMEFISDTRTLGIWAIGFTILYKFIVQTIMVLTTPKTTLDKRWIWHLDSTLAFFVLIFIALVWPEWIGLPKPGRPAPGTAVNDRLLVYNGAWFQLWGFLNWSALAVLKSTWDERGRFIWEGRRRKLRIRDGRSIVAEDA